MPDPDNNERSIFSSKFDQKPDRIRERINNAPPVPKVKRTRIQSILTALPVLMLLAGLWYHWNGEQQQLEGAPIAEQAENLVGTFDRISPRDDSIEGKHYLWLRTDERTRPIRITYEQKRELKKIEFSAGDSINVQAAPSVSGSTVLWLMDVSASQ